MTGPLLRSDLFDRPNRYIGQPSPRADAARLLQGRGRFVDDVTLPRMVHAAFVRSPMRTPGSCRSTPTMGGPCRVSWRSIPGPIWPPM